ncbi:MAG TPA: ankyrin repeat domain-containing protein [Blastocatellia bacterium]|nr:ankyrin repeat domain-containing protein [Blastocatellia bacterium]
MAERCLNRGKEAATQHSATLMASHTEKILIEALRRGDLKEFKSQLRSNPSIAGSSAVICEAGRAGSQKAFELLARAGADLNASYRGYRPIHSLIQERPHGDRSLISEERSACLRWMLENGADPEHLGGWPSMRAILAAAFVGEPAYVAVLRNAGAVIDGFVAAALGDIKRVRRELQKDGDFATARDSGGLTALHCVAGSRMGKNTRTREALMEIARLLLDAGADPRATVRSWSHDVDVIYFAASPSKRELFELLLERGADPASAFCSAIWQTHTELADIAMRRGANPDRIRDEGRPVLNQMVRWGQIKQALWLLEKGASPNISDERGWTAVHQAASRGNERLLKVLLESGGDTRKKDKEGKTPVDIARTRNRPALVALLSS